MCIPGLARHFFVTVPSCRSLPAVLLRKVSNVKMLKLKWNQRNRVRNFLLNLLKREHFLKTNAVNAKYFWEQSEKVSL